MSKARHKFELFSIKDILHPSFDCPLCNQEEATKFSKEDRQLFHDSWHVWPSYDVVPDSND